MKLIREIEERCPGQIQGPADTISQEVIYMTYFC